MLLFTLKKLFKVLIGNLPEDKQDELWKKFLELLEVAVKAGAEGTAKGLKE